MANAVIPLEGLKDALANGPLGGTLRVILFTDSSYVPSSSSVFTDLHEPGNSWYARQTPAFGAVGDDGSGHAQSIAPAVTFTCDGTSSVTVYGWALINTSGPKLRALNVLAAPITLTNNGDNVTVALTDLLYIF